MASLLTRFLEALEERTGLPTALGAVGGLPTTRAARTRIFLGTASLTFLAIVVASGVGLAFHYSASTTHAWASVAYIERELFLGKITRALHYQGTNALLICLVIQLFVTVMHGAYRRPREVAWWLSLGVLALVLGESMTGALLPWDEQGYWASRVETGIMASAPGGAIVRQIAQGGNDFGHLMLTRYFALHVLVLPPLLVGLVAMQLAVLRRHGPAPGLRTAPLADPFFPAGTFAAAVGAFFASVLVFALAKKFGAPLEAPADPSGGFPPRPTWYFRALYELRRHFEGPLEPIATMVIPGIAAALLVALPFLDRTDRPRRHAPIVAAVGIGIVLAGVITWSGYRRDANDKTFVQMSDEAAKKRDKAISLAALGVPPQGALFMLRNTPEERGRKTFAERCAGCHPVGQQMEKPKGPDLAGYGGQGWLAGCIAHPEAPEYFGKTKVSGMESYEGLGKEKLAVLAGFLSQLKNHPGVKPDDLPAELQAGRKAFEAEGCDSCHSLVPDESNAAPNLSGYASERWLAGLLLDPGHELYFGEDNDMPSYRGKLDDRQIADLVMFLRTLEGKPPRFTLASTTP